MGCRRFDRLGPAWASGDLRGRKAAAWRRHLEACPDCRARAEGLEAATREARAALPAPTELSPAEWTRLLASLPLPEKRPARVPGWGWALAASAAAALLALALLLPGRGPRELGPDAGPAPAPAEVARAAFPERFELRLATADPKIKVVWVFDKNLEL
jgi:anti-sigma factor RsiW